MKKEEFKRRMKSKMEKSMEYGVEGGHAVADKVLLEIAEREGYDEIAEMFKEMEKWYA